MEREANNSQRAGTWLTGGIVAASGAALGTAWTLWGVKLAEDAAAIAGTVLSQNLSTLATLSLIAAGLVAATAWANTSPRLDAAVRFASISLMLVAGLAALFLAPEEKTMRAIQRIFYFHVSSAWTAFSAFFVVFVSNIAYLRTRDFKWDWLGVAGAEVGLAFCTVVLVTGPIWAKPAWGIWWTWDARLTSTLVLWLMYVSYLLLRNLLPDAERQARICALFGIFAFLDVPLVYFSIRLWRTQHPSPVIGGGEGSGLDPAMGAVLLVCWAAMLAMMISLMQQRFRLEALRSESSALKLAAAEQAEQEVAESTR